MGLPLRGDEPRSPSQVDEVFGRLVGVVEHIEGNIQALETKLESVLRQRGPDTTAFSDEKLMRADTVPLVGHIDAQVERLLLVERQLSSVLGRLEL